MSMIVSEDPARESQGENDASGRVPGVPIAGPARVRPDAAGARWPLERTREPEVVMAAALAALVRLMRETGRLRVDGSTLEFDARDEDLRVYHNVNTGRFAVLLQPRER